MRSDAGLYGYERALRRVGLVRIAGADEAGRGACAGPLVAGAAILPDTKAGIVPGLADSKLLTEKARERVLRPDRPARALAGRSSSSSPRSATGSACTSPTSRPCVGPSRCSTWLPTTCSPTASPSTGSVSPDWRSGRVTASPPASPPDRCWRRSPATASCAELHDEWPAYDFKTHKGYVTDGHAAALDRARPLARPPDALRQRPRAPAGDSSRPSTRAGRKH